MHADREVFAVFWFVRLHWLYTVGSCCFFNDRFEPVEHGRWAVKQLHAREHSVDSEII